MDARLTDRLQTGIESAAAAMFGGAVAYATWAWLASSEPQRWWAYSGGGGVLAFLLCLRAMRIATAQKPSLPLSVFNVRDIEFEYDELLLTDADRMEPDELLLTDADRISEPGAEPLVLEDILAEIGPDARVVRLFDPKSTPAAAQARARIDNRFGEGASAPPLSDASQALSQALAQLRRSLR